MAGSTWDKKIFPRVIFFKFRLDKSNIEMHSTSHLVNLGKYLLINSLLVDILYHRAFYNRATGLLAANNGYRVTAHWLLSQHITNTWV